MDGGARATRRASVYSDSCPSAAGPGFEPRSRGLRPAPQESIESEADSDVSSHKQLSQKHELLQCLLAWKHSECDLNLLLVRVDSSLAVLAPRLC